MVSWWPSGGSWSGGQHRACDLDQSLLGTYRPHVGQTRLELLPGELGVPDVYQLPLDRGGVIKGHLLAPVHSGHHGPDADCAPEVLRDINRDHVLHTDVEVLGAMDLETGYTHGMLKHTSKIHVFPAAWRARGTLSDTPDLCHGSPLGDRSLVDMHDVPVQSADSRAGLENSPTSDHSLPPTLPTHRTIPFNS